MVQVVHAPSDQHGHNERYQEQHDRHQHDGFTASSTIDEKTSRATTPSSG